MRFPYREIEPNKFGPIVDLHLFGRNRLFRFYAFIDSGADYSVFDADAARIMGLSHRKGKKLPITVGDGDRMIVYRHDLTILFSGQKFIAPICFSEDLGAGFNLLGRAGFFDRFVICFHERDRYTSVILEQRNR
jgi:hypothetical protein